MLDFASLKECFNNQYENDEFDVKESIISIEKISKIVLSFLNSKSNIETGYIIIGVTEDADGKSDFNKTKPVVFPQEIAIEEKGKRKSKFDNYESYYTKIIDFLSKNITPKIPLESLKDLIAYFSVKITSDENYILVIKIQRNPGDVIQYKDKKFYARLKQDGQNDFGTHPMDSDELTERLRERYYSNPNLPSPCYYNTKPAVPELTVLFDYIYYGRDNKAIVLLEQISTLTQMIDSEGNNALHIASLYGRVDIVNNLVNTYKMSTRQTNHEGENPLLTAAYAGRLEIVKVLLNIDEHSIVQRDRLGYDVFLKACGYGHCELIDFLHKEYGDSIFQSKTFSGRNGLQVAACSPSKVVVGYLLKHFKWSSEDLEGALDIARSYKKNAENSGDGLIQKRTNEYQHIENLIIKYRCKNNVGNGQKFFSNRNVMLHASGLPRSYSI